MGIVGKPAANQTSMRPLYRRILSLDGGGMLLLIARARDETEEPGDMPWPLTRAELDAVCCFGLKAIAVEDYVDEERPPVRRFRAAYRYPLSTNST